MIDILELGELVGALDGNDRPVGFMDPVDDRRGGGDQLQAEFPLQPFLDDFHVQEAEETAAKTESEGNRGFRLVGEGGVIQVEFCQGVPKLFVLGRINGIKPGKDHRLHFLEPGKGNGARSVKKGHGVAYFGVLNLLDAGNDESDFAGGERGDLHHYRGKHSDLEGLVGWPPAHKLDFVAFFQGPV